MRWTPDVSWALRKLFSIPEHIDFRMISRLNWPKENHYSTTSIPYDADKKIPVESANSMDISSCWIVPHPEDPNKSVIKGLGKSADSAGFEKIPKFALKMVKRI